MTRLINADAFATFIKNAISEHKYRDLELGEHITVAEVLEQVVSELDGTSLDGFKNAPTVDAGPVRHGKWVPRMGTLAGKPSYVIAMKCSVCGADALEAEGNEFLTDYCPWCGSKMDGEPE